MVSGASSTPSYLQAQNNYGLSDANMPELQLAPNESLGAGTSTYTGPVTGGQSGNQYYGAQANSQFANSGPLSGTLNEPTGGTNQLLAELTAITQVLEALAPLLALFSSGAGTTTVPNTVTPTTPTDPTTATAPTASGIFNDVQAIDDAIANNPSQVATALSQLEQDAGVTSGSAEDSRLQDDVYAIQTSPSGNSTGAMQGLLSDALTIAGVQSGVQ